jgi:hypothetical protein
MDNKGFTIIHDSVRGWIVIVSVFEEWLAVSEQDARNQIDSYLNRTLKTIAA